MIKKSLLITAGCVSLGLGAIGVVLPLLPTAPFILLAAACFAESSDRFHDWLCNTKFFGQIIHDWRATRSMPKKSKYVAIATIFCSGAFSVAIIEPTWIKAVLVATLCIPTAIILRIPNTEDIAITEGSDN